MDPKKVAQLLALLNPELAQDLLRLLDAVPKLERENKELLQTLEASNVELNRVNDRRIEAEAERDRLHRENRAGDNSIRHLKEKVEKL